MNGQNVPSLHIVHRLSKIAKVILEVKGGGGGGVGRGGGINNKQCGCMNYSRGDS